MAEDLLPLVGVNFGGNQGGDGDDSDNTDSDSDIDPHEQREDLEAASDDEEEEEEGVAAENHHRPPDINYDHCLPGAHSYLGTDMEEVRGRTIHEDDTFITLPLLSLPGVVLVPGQTLPLHLFQPSIVAMVRRLVETDKTFGLVTARYTPDHQIKQSEVGTTAEIYSYKEEQDEPTGIITLRVKATGRQRFEVVEKRRQTDGILMGKVRILSDHTLDDALEGARPTSHCRLCAVEQNNKPGGSPRPGGMGDMQSLVADFFGQKYPRRKQVDRFTAANFTWWPPWVYKQYDALLVMDKVKKELTSWNETLKKENMPGDPLEFSYWVAGILPLDDSMKIFLMGIKNPVQRLRCELGIMQKCTMFICCHCGQTITNKRDVFSMAVEGPMAAYVNPGGYVHETLTVYKAQGLVLRGAPSTENSWFPGYAWTILECRQCHSHMGWKFTAVKRKLKPEKFWGLVRASLQPGFHSLEEEEGKDEWIPTL